LVTDAEREDCLFFGSEENDEIFQKLFGKRVFRKQVFDRLSGELGKDGSARLVSGANELRRRVESSKDRVNIQIVSNERKRAYAPRQGDL
jgi:hypothetical protein